MIQLLEDGSIDMNVLEIKDIVDIPLLQKFQDNFAIGMDCASVTVDRNGIPVTDPSSYTEFCDGFIHKCEIGDNRCAMSHNQMGERAAQSGRPFIGACHAGLIDFAAPIIINNELIGTVLGGQLLSKEPQADFYRSIAEEIGVSEDGLVNAVNKVKITTMGNINAAAEVLFIVVNSLAENGFARIRLEILTKKLADKFMEISATLQELTASSLSIKGQQDDLNKEIVQVEHYTEKINDILKSIDLMATNTKLLGFNSAIEAARAGVAGRGFAVVATEIQQLSENSKKTANNIADLTKNIKASVKTTVKTSENTLYTTEIQTRAMEDVSVAVQEIVHLADELSGMMRTL